MSLAVPSLKPNLIFKYRMASIICVTNLDTILQKIVWKAVVEFITFHSHSTRATFSILGVEKVQQLLEGAT